MSLPVFWCTPVSVCEGGPPARPSASPPQQTCQWFLSSPLFTRGKQTPLGVSDFSLSLDEVPAIYIFVWSEEGKHISRAQATSRPAGCRGSLLRCRGLPSWYLSRDQEVHAVNALKGLLGDTNKNNMQMRPQQQVDLIRCCQMNSASPIVASPCLPFGSPHLLQMWFNLLRLG